MNKVEFIAEVLFSTSYTDLREAIINSKNAYGLKAYAESEFRHKKNILVDVKKFFLTADGEIFYLADCGRQGQIWHKFSWTGCLSSGGVAIVEKILDPQFKTLVLRGNLTEEDGIVMMNFLENPIGLRRTAYLYDRDKLRPTHIQWTNDHF
jgi:hypothetical protein